MGQCECLSHRRDTDLRHSPQSLNSPLFTPSQSKRKSLLMSSLLMSEDFQEEDYTHLFSNDIELDNFEIDKVIGRGSYAKIYLVKKYSATGDVKYFALKVIKKKALHDKEQMHHTLQEKNILMQVKHPFIVGLHYAF